MLLLRQNFLLNNILNPGFCNSLIDKKIFVSLKNRIILCKKGFVFKFNILIGRKFKDTESLLKSRKLHLT